MYVPQGQERSFLETPMTTPRYREKSFLIYFEPGNEQDFKRVLEETRKAFPDFALLRQPRLVSGCAAVGLREFGDRAIIEPVFKSGALAIQTPVISAHGPTGLVAAAATSVTTPALAEALISHEESRTERADSQVQDLIKSSVRGARRDPSLPDTNAFVTIPPPTIEPLVQSSAAGGAAVGLAAAGAMASFPGTPANARSLLDGTLWGLTNIRATFAWSTREPRPNPQVLIPVAILDTGVNVTHPNLIGNISKVAKDNRYHIRPGTDGSPLQDDDLGDRHGHGSHLAGTIGATGRVLGDGPPLQVVGVNWRVPLIPVRFLDDNGFATLENASNAVGIVCSELASDKSKKLVVNMSWGIGGVNAPIGLRNLIDRYKDNVLFVAAAGNAPRGQAANNNDDKPIYPASFAKESENLISVLAVDRCDRLPSYSNYGPTSVDIGAPGGLGDAKNRDEDIYSTWTNDAGGFPTYAAVAGTSMATAYVSGAAALVWADNPTWSPKQVKEALMKNKRPVDSLKGKCIAEGVVDLKYLVSGGKDSDFPKLPGESGCPSLRPVLPELDLPYHRLGAFMPVSPVSAYLPPYTPVWPPVRSATATAYSSQPAFYGTRFDASSLQVRGHRGWLIGH
jgi:hypothetical protein